MYIHVIYLKMRKSKVNVEASLKQFDMLLPDNIREDWKSALTTCKDATGGEKNACEAAYKLVLCFAENNPSFRFV